MNKPEYDLAMRLGAATPANPQEVLARKIRVVLETPMGSLPWDPGFGTQLGDLVGKVANSGHMATAKMRVAAALSAAIPEIEITEIHAHLEDFRANTGDHREVPTAERVMASEAIASRLQLSLTVMSESGPLEIAATLDE